MEPENNPNVEYATLYQTCLDRAPQEVRDFLWSQSYKDLLLVIENKLSLTQEQSEILGSAIFNMLIDFFDQEDFEEEIEKLMLSEENKEILLEYIYEFFIEPTVQEIIDNPSQEDDADENVLVGKTKPSDVMIEPSYSATILSSIQAKMQGASVVAPIASIGQKFAPGPQTQNNTPPASIRPADPYREMPLS